MFWLRNKKVIIFVTQLKARLICTPILHVTCLVTTLINVYVTQLENAILLNRFALVIDKGHSDDSNIVVFTCHTGLVPYFRGN